MCFPCAGRWDQAQGPAHPKVVYVDWNIKDLQSPASLVPARRLLFRTSIELLYGGVLCCGALVLPRRSRSERPRLSAQRNAASGQFEPGALSSHGLEFRVRV